MGLAVPFLDGQFCIKKNDGVCEGLVRAGPVLRVTVCVSDPFLECVNVLLMLKLFHVPLQVACIILFLFVLFLFYFPIFLSVYAVL